MDDQRSDARPERVSRRRLLGGMAAGIGVLAAAGLDAEHLHSPGAPRAHTKKPHRPLPATTPAGPITVTQTTLGNVFVTGQRPAFGVTADSYPVSWSVHDLWGNLRGSGMQAAAGRLEVPIATPGYYELELEAAGSTLMTSFACLTPPPSPVPQPSPFMLQTHFHAYGTQAMELLTLSGVPMVRDEIYWDDVELTPGVYTVPAYAQQYIPLLQEHGIGVLIELDYTNPLYDGGDTPYTADAIAAFAGYGQWIVEHFGQQIGCVEVWNEYNGGFSNGPAAKSVQNYLTILEQSYQAVKQVRPDVSVVAPATAGVPMEWLEQLFALGALSYIDAVSVHPYQPTGSPEGIAPLIGELAALMQRYDGGIQIPIWVSEIGWSTGGENMVSERVQAQYLARAYAVTLSSGVAKTNWYDSLNDGTDPTNKQDNFGLIRADGDQLGSYTPKPAYVAYATLTRQLAGKAPSGADTNLPENVSSCVFSGAGSETRIIWSTGSPAGLTLDAGGPLQITDLMGASTTHQPVNGQVRVTASQDAIYVSGPVTGVTGGAPAARGRR